MVFTVSKALGQGFCHFLCLSSVESEQKRLKLQVTEAISWDYRYSGRDYCWQTIIISENAWVFRYWTQERNIFFSEHCKFQELVSNLFFLTKTSAVLFLKTNPYWSLRGSWKAWPRSSQVLAFLYCYQRSSFSSVWWIWQRSWYF